MFKKFSPFFMMAILSFCLTHQAAAATLTTYNAPLGGPGYYNGTGTVDGNFTIATTDYAPGQTAQAGLRFAERFVGPLTPSPTNFYFTPSPSAQINLEYSLFMTGFTISDFTYSLTINNLSTGLSMTLDPSNVLLGNTYWDGVGETMVPSGTRVGFQNSEYLGFSFIASQIGYVAGNSVYASLQYQNLNEKTGHQVGVYLNTDPGSVPEPSTYGMMVSGVGILAYGIRRRRNRQVLSS